MSTILKMIEIPTASSTAYHQFLQGFPVWWPKDYTWSKDKLVLIKIEPHEKGHCSEYGPHDFRCDWGRVIELIPGKKIRLLWQIDHDRIPQPNPDKCSEVEVEFIDFNEHSCHVKLVHRHFEKHGDKNHLYFELMNGQHGWDYILGCYADYCTK